MSRSSTLTLAVLLFFTIFAVAAPTNSTCGGHDVPGKVKNSPAVPKGTPTPTVPAPNPTNTTVVDVDDVVTLASSGTHSGTATWFNVGLGACGFTDTNSDFIVALAQPDWDSKSHCNKQIQITNPKNQRTKTATVRDLCPSCPSGNLDLSPSLFQALADDLGLGVFQMTWQYT